MPATGTTIFDCSCLTISNTKTQIHKYTNTYTHIQIYKYKDDKNYFLPTFNIEQYLTTVLQQFVVPIYECIVCLSLWFQFVLLVPIYGRALS